MVATMKAEGFDKLDRQLAQLAAGIPERELRAALRAGGELIVEQAQRLAPVDTGRLRDSIRVTDDRDARVYGKVNTPDVSVFVGPVGSVDGGDVFYARFIEFGTVNMAPQPFMRPAIAAKRAVAERAIAERLRVSIGKATR